MAQGLVEAQQQVFAEAQRQGRPRNGFEGADGPETHAPQAVDRIAADA